MPGPPLQPARILLSGSCIQVYWSILAWVQTVTADACLDLACSRTPCVHARSGVAMATLTLTSPLTAHEPGASSQAAGEISGLEVALHGSVLVEDPNDSHAVTLRLVEHDIGQNFVSLYFRPY